MNHDKSSIFFSPNTPESIILPICNLLKIPQVDNPGKYLGLPTIWGRSKKEALVYIKEGICSKLTGWKQNCLSMAGKEVLLKAVAQAIPSYPMMCFKFPSSLCKELSSEMANFWWGGDETKAKTHWKSWAHMCKSKEEGGLGFRDLESFNIALLAKQCWRIINNPDAPWVQILKARYFPDCDFFEAEKGYRASWAWSSLLQGRDIIQQGSKWQVLSGKQVKIWDHDWIPPPHNGLISPTSQVPCDAPTFVYDLIDRTSESWNLQTIAPLISNQVFTIISSIPFGSSTEDDRLIWPLNLNGSYTVKSGYHWHHSRIMRQIPNLSHTSHSPDAVFWKSLWSTNTVPKIRNFLWRACSNALPTFQNLHRRHIAKSPICQLCEVEEESIEHTLLLCPWVCTVWFGSPLGYKVDKARITTLDRWLQGLTAVASTKTRKVELLSLVSYCLWAIWKARCNYIYKAIIPSPSHVIQQAISQHLEFIQANCRVLNIPTLSRTHDERWKPPDQNFYKINSDAAWDKTTLKAGFGVVIRDNHGSMCGGLSMPSSCISSLAAEAEAALHGIILAKDLGLPQICIESDSLELINCVKSKSLSGNWIIFPILQRIRDKLIHFTNVKWYWVSRQANRSAHLAAMLASRTVGLNRWASQPPPSLVCVLRSDGLPCPPSPVLTT